MPRLARCLPNGSTQAESGLMAWSGGARPKLRFIPNQRPRNPAAQYPVKFVKFGIVRSRLSIIFRCIRLNDSRLQSASTLPT